MPPSSLAFVRNPLYWDAENVKLDRLEMKIVAEESTKIGDFENGGLDLTSVYFAEWAKKLDESPAGKGGYVKNIVTMPETKYVFFNQTVPPFSNKKVRLAFSLALDREEIYRDVSLGLEPAAWGWLPPAMDLDGENFRKLAGEPVRDLAAAHPDPRALLVIEIGRASCRERV